MARFSEDDFDYQNYIKARPDIEPDSVVWKRILAAHDKNGGQYELALDLGCGPAKQAPKLAKLFDETLHVDVSARMVHAAAAHWQDVRTKTGAKPQFKVGSSSSMPFIKSHSVDLVVSGNAAQYFHPYSKWWAELQRIVKPGGMVAFWLDVAAFSPRYPGETVHGFLEDSRITPYQTFPWKEAFTALQRIPTPDSEGRPTKLYETSKDIASADGVDSGAWTTERWDWQANETYQEGDEVAMKVLFGKDELHELVCSYSMYDKYLHVGNIERKSKLDFAWQDICDNYPKDKDGREVGKLEFYMPLWLTIVSRKMDS